MMQDCSPAIICCGDAALRDGILQAWPAAPPQYLFDEIFSHPGASVNGNPKLADSDPVTIIYTSGTSGEAKGVILTAGNVGHMLACTSGRLDLLMENKLGQDRVFHYLPFCFAGSWIMLLTCLLRRNLLTLNMDLGKAGGRNARRRARLFPERPGAAGTHAQSGGRTALENRRPRTRDLPPRQGGMDAQAGRAVRGSPTGPGWRWPMRRSFPPSARK